MSGKKWSPEEKELLRKLWDEGRTGSEIAREIGRGLKRQAVLAKARRMGLEPRPRDPAPDTRNARRERWHRKLEESRAFFEQPLEDQRSYGR